MLSYAPFLSRHVASLVMEINNLLFIHSDEYFHHRSCFVFPAVTEYCFLEHKYFDADMPILWRVGDWIALLLECKTM